MDEIQWPNWSYDCKDVSGQFLDGPGWIKKLTLTADDTNPTSVSFYDGHTTSGKLKLTLRTVLNRTQTVDFDIPFRVDQGLYAEMADNIECVSVQYNKDKP